MLHDTTVGRTEMVERHSLRISQRGCEDSIVCKTMFSQGFETLAGV